MQLRRNPSRLSRMVTVVGLALVVAACAPDDPVREIQEKVISPCCKMGAQTIAVHESPVARQLRDEVVARVRAGESEDSILADFRRRYGPEIFVHANWLSQNLGAVTAGILGLAFLLVMLLARHWARQVPDDGRAGLAAGGMVAAGAAGGVVATGAAGGPGPGGPGGAGNDDEALEDRLDDELDRID